MGRSRLLATSRLRGTIKVAWDDQGGMGRSRLHGTIKAERDHQVFVGRSRLRGTIKVAWGDQGCFQDILVVFQFKLLITMRFVLEQYGINCSKKYLSRIIMDMSVEQGCVRRSGIC